MLGRLKAAIFPVHASTHSNALWAIPTLVLSVILTLNFQYGLNLPAPFFIILVSVVVAATYGGTKAGLLAGVFAACFLAHSYWFGFGPAELTGGLPEVFLGTALFLFLGFRLGQIKDERDIQKAQILEANKALKASLLSETEEKNKSAAQVFESEKRLRMAVRVSGIGYYKWDFATGNCLYCSRQHAAHFGITPERFYELNKGRAPYTDNIHKDDRSSFIEAVARIDGGEAVLFEYRAMHPDGTIRFIRQITEPVFDEDGNQTEVVGSSIDLTELREAEARLRQSQRIEAIGTLTGGVAHDFNNILAIIMGNIELAEDSENEAERRAYLRHALDATRRGASLTRNLLSFARRAHLEPQRLNLNDVVRSTLNWGTRILPVSISIETELGDDLWDCELDPTSLENAIVNLVLNARDAMPDSGTITIKTANLTLFGPSLEVPGEELAPGQYVMLSVSDTGQGIAPDHLEKIFEPFHTSKPFGEGSGLGLSMVEGFIKQSGGAVQVTSEVGQGTEFILYFKADTTANNNLDDVQPVPSHNKMARARILLAEDEIGVARVIQKTLEDAGYEVCLAHSGDDGLKLFQETGPFDLILTDVVMPGALQGPALVTAIRKSHPDLPCIFMSGYASENKIQGKGLHPSDLRILKPIARENLLKAVAASLRMEVEA